MNVGVASSCSVMQANSWTQKDAGGTTSHVQHLLILCCCKTFHEMKASNVGFGQLVSLGMREVNHVFAAGSGRSPELSTGASEGVAHNEMSTSTTKQHQGRAPSAKTTQTAKQAMLSIPVVRSYSFNMFLGGYSMP